MKKKKVGITLAIIIMASLLAGCGEHVEENQVEENQPEEVQPSEIEINQEDGLMPESDPGEDEEPTDEIAADETVADETNDAVPVLLVRAVRHDSDGNIKYIESLYDTFGNQINETFLYEDGSPSSWTEWKYDASGNKISEIFRSEDRIYRWYEWEYDASGNCIKHTSYEPVPEINDWWEYEYDSSGNCTKEIRYNPDGSIMLWYEYEYIGLSYKASGQLPEEITKQIEIYVNQREAWLPEPRQFMPTYYYTWNDLNRDGSLELICSYCEGTGWYSYSYVYAINSGGEVECVAELGGEDAPDLLWGLELYTDVPKGGQAPEHFYIRTEDLLHDNRDLERADTVITFTAELTEWQRERFRSCLEEYSDGTHSELVEATYWGSGWETISKEEWEQLEEEFLKDKELITADFAWDRLWTYTYEELAENALTDKELGEALEALYISWQELEP